MFGQRFQAVLQQYPHLQTASRGLLDEIRVLSDRACVDGSTCSLACGRILIASAFVREMDTDRGFF